MPMTAEERLQLVLIVKQAVAEAIEDQLSSILRDTTTAVVSAGHQKEETCPAPATKTELMYGLLGPICTNFDQVVSYLQGKDKSRRKSHAGACPRALYGCADNCDEHKCMCLDEVA